MTTQITDHIEQAKARLLTQLRDSASHAGLINGLFAEVQEIEDATFSLFSLDSIDDSSGVQLDAIGKIIGADREALEDAEYKLRLKAQILINRSSGEIESIVQVAKLLVPAATVKLTELFPLGIELYLGDVLITDGAPYAVVLNGVRAAGVKLVTITYTAARASTFTLNGTSAQGLNNGRLASASTGT